MTSRCKFDIGNCEFGRLATGTLSEAIHWAKLSGCETAGGNESERNVAPLGFESDEAEHVVDLRRQHDASLFTEIRGGVAHPVSRRPQVGKAVEGNLRGRMMYWGHRDVLEFDKTALMTEPISVRSEEVRDSSCGVGEAHSINDTGDSTTSGERRSFTWCVTVRSSGREPFFERGMRRNK